MNSWFFQCRANGSFKHISRRDWLQLVTGNGIALTTPPGQIFLQCQVEQASVRITRWESTHEGGLAQCSNSVSCVQERHKSLAHLLAGEALDVERLARQVQVSLQDYIGDLLDACAAPKTPLHRVA